MPFLARDEKYITTTTRTTIVPGRVFLSEPELDRHSVFYALISGTTYFYTIFICFDGNDNNDNDNNNFTKRT